MASSKFEFTIPGTGLLSPAVVAFLTFIRVLSRVCCTTCHLFEEWHVFCSLVLNPQALELGLAANTSPAIDQLYNFK